MISVCMATYNGAKYIKEQIDSILVQLGADDELVVSDDGSTDGTIDIVLGYRDSRIQLYRGSFHSPIYNFENALKQAKGNYILLCDQDDIWMEGRVKALVGRLQNHDVVVSNATYIDGDGKPFDRLYFTQAPTLRVRETLMHNHFFGASMAFRRTVLNHALPFPKHLPMHDQWIGLMGLHYGKVCFEERPLLKYRRHGNNASFNGVSHNPYSKRIMFRVRIVYYYIMRILGIS